MSGDAVMAVYTTMGKLEVVRKVYSFPDKTM